MLQKIAGKNFQSYEEFEMEFVPGVNVIIGKSDNGKSAAFRLMDWIRTNRPLGDAFRSEWGGTTEGDIWTTDGHHVKRVKDDKENYYEIDGKVLKAFGQNPPDEVFQALNMTEINVQSQDLPPFLLSDSPGEVAKALNKAASLEIIDVSIANLTRGLKIASKEMETSDALLKRQKEQLSRYENLSELESQIVTVEQIERQKNSLITKRTVLANLAFELTRIEGERSEYANLPELESLLSDLKEQKAEWVELNRKRDLLNQLSAGLKQVERDISGIPDIVKIEKYVERLRALSEKRKTDQTKREGLQKLKEGLTAVEHNLRGTKATLKELETEYEELAPDTCPLCGGEM